MGYKYKLPRGIRWRDVEVKYFGQDHERLSAKEKYGVIANTFAVDKPTAYLVARTVEMCSEEEARDRYKKAIISFELLRGTIRALKKVNAYYENMENGIVRLPRGLRWSELEMKYFGSEHHQFSPHKKTKMIVDALVKEDTYLEFFSDDDHLAQFLDSLPNQTQIRARYNYRQAIVRNEGFKGSERPLMHLPLPYNPDSKEVPDSLDSLVSH